MGPRDRDARSTFPPDGPTPRPHSSPNIPKLPPRQCSSISGRPRNHSANPSLEHQCPPTATQETRVRVPWAINPLRNRPAPFAPSLFQRYVHPASRHQDPATRRWRVGPIAHVFLVRDPASTRAASHAGAKKADTSPATDRGTRTRVSRGLAAVGESTTRPDRLVGVARRTAVPPLAVVSSPSLPPPSPPLASARAHPHHTAAVPPGPAPPPASRRGKP